MPLNLPVEKWMAEFDDLMGQYQFRYFYTFAALWIIIFQLSLPQFVSTPTLRFLLKELIEPASPECAHFMSDFFIPEVGQLTHKYRLSLGESIDVLTRFFGVLVKILWAFLW